MMWQPGPHPGFRGLQLPAAAGGATGGDQMAKHKWIKNVKTDLLGEELRRVEELAEALWEGLIPDNFTSIGEKVLTLTLNDWKDLLKWIYKSDLVNLIDGNSIDRLTDDERITRITILFDKARERASIPPASRLRSGVVEAETAPVQVRV
jgi:hypothetical protein